MTNLSNEVLETRTTIKAVREDLKISQTEAALDLSVSRGCYLAWEKDLSNMTVAHLIKVCQYFGTTPNELVHIP